MGRTCGNLISPASAAAAPAAASGTAYRALCVQQTKQDDPAAEKGQEMSACRRNSSTTCSSPSRSFLQKWWMPCRQARTKLRIVFLRYKFQFATEIETVCAKVRASARERGKLPLAGQTKMGQSVAFQTVQVVYSLCVHCLHVGASVWLCPSLSPSDSVSLSLALSLPRSRCRVVSICMFVSCPRCLDTHINLHL